MVEEDDATSCSHGTVHWIKARSNLIMYQVASRPDEVTCNVYETLAFNV